MKRSMYGVMFAALLSLSVVARATTTDELIISSGSDSCTIVDNVSPPTGTGCGGLFGDVNPNAGTDAVLGSINGWTINITSGTSNSPNTNPLLDLSSETANCSAACTGANSLTIVFTDINFTAPGSLTSTYSNTQTGAGTTTQSAYYSDTNALNTLTTQIGTTLTFTGSNVGTVSGGTAPSSPYSLALVQNFSGTATFSVDGNITAVPEGWSLSSALGMLGFGVVALVVARRRGLVKTSL
jgi:hypothetical protein